MPTDHQDQVLARLCPHRGKGTENTLEAIEAGIEISPFMVEFDVQWHNNDLYLGHPPELGTDTLAAALKLFKNTPIIPKIDIKLTPQTAGLALDCLVQQLESWNPRTALVNIAGELATAEYMLAESDLMNRTTGNTLLNIDLDRYRGKTAEEIAVHVEGLHRRPFSLSPNLETSTTEAILFAKQHEIHHIHFWSYFDKQYSLKELYERLKQCTADGLEVYFDTKMQNISDAKHD